MSKIIYRFLRAEAMTDNLRCIRVAFSSETPVLRMGDGMDHPVDQPYYEVLDHDSENADLNYLQNRGAVLDEHDPKCPIGVCTKAEIDTKDKMGRAELEMDEAGLGAERSRQMRSGMRPHISFGYDQTKLISETKHTDDIPIKRFAWRAHEISSVAIPADLMVGVGRSFEPVKIDFSKLTIADIAALTNEQRQNMKRILLDKDATGGGGSSAAVIDEPQIRTKALNAERERVKQITATADILIKDHSHASELVRTIANESISGDVSLGDFQVRAMKEVLGAHKLRPVTGTSVGASARDMARYSIRRAIASCLERGSNEPDPTSLEGGLHRALIKAAGSGLDVKGFLVPHDVDCTPTHNRRSIRKQRDLNVDIFGQGGAFVATEIVTPIIEILRNKLVCARMGITVMGGLSGNVAIPRQTAAATAYSLPESSTLTKSTQALDQVLLSPHRVGAWNDYTRQLLIQSSVDVENFIRDDLMKVLAIYWDLMILYGQGGGSQPLGIMNTPGVGSVAVTQGAPTYAQLVAFETALAVLNADQGNMAFATTPAVRGVLKNTAVILGAATTVVAGAQSAVWTPTGEDMGDVTGYNAFASNNVPGNAIIFGNWSEAIHGLYGGFDVIVNPYSRDTDAAVRITINSFGDVVLRHPQSFAVSAGPAV